MLLCQFSFKNFKSYRGDTVLDMRAMTDVDEFSDSIIVADDTRLLPVSVVYGPNAGGKTNLLSALACLVTTVVRPVVELKKTRTGFVMQSGEACVPFLFDDVSRDEPTEFLLFFCVDGYEYRYYLALKNGTVVSEMLDAREMASDELLELYGRDADGITLGGVLASEQLNTAVNPKMAYLSFLAINYDLAPINRALTWLERCLFCSYANPWEEQQLILSEEAAIKGQFIRAMNDMGIDITDYQLDAKSGQLLLERRLEDRVYSIAYQNESAGTKKVIAVMPLILTALREGRLVVVDELDAKLHPKLLTYIIKLFKNEAINKHGAQLIFSSHDMTTMNSTVFRRDEIWFAAEDEQHASELYSLNELRNEDGKGLARTEYSRQYLEGRYGADPYLQNMLEEGAWQ